MFSASQLTDDQKATLHQWASEGATIADLQKRMKEEFDLSITYMDARFLVLDLEVKIEEPEEETRSEPADNAPALDSGQGVPDGGVTVTKDSIAVPGALVSGKVTFSDGEGAIWMIDQMGRPSLDPDTPGYRPEQADIESFQKQLSELMQKEGM